MGHRPGRQPTSDRAGTQITDELRSLVERVRAGQPTPATEATETTRQRPSK